jgi:hypothetical protein
MTKSASVLRDLAVCAPARRTPWISPGRRRHSSPCRPTSASPSSARASPGWARPSPSPTRATATTDHPGTPIDVGGTWHDNSYPGCRCDVPSNLYSFSFAPNPLDRDLLGPARDRALPAADGPGVRRAGQDRLRRRPREGRLGRRPQVWHIETSRGSLTADFLISGGGLLSNRPFPISRAPRPSPARPSIRRSGTTRTT